MGAPMECAIIEKRTRGGNSVRKVCEIIVLMKRACLRIIEAEKADGYSLKSNE